MKQQYSLDELIKGCAAAKREAQRMLYQVLAPKMLAICMRYAKDRHEAEDILQIGFLKVYQKAETFKGDGSAEGWIRRIMVNTAIEVYRKNQRMMNMTAIEEAYDSAQTTFSMDNLETKDLLRLIQQLPGVYKLVFNMYVIEGYSHKEIAEELGISESSSKSQLFRARAILREKLIKMESTDHAAAIR